MLEYRGLPDEIRLNRDDSIERHIELSEPFSLSYDDALSVSLSGDERLNAAVNKKASVKLFDSIILKELDVSERQSINVIPGGHSVGVAMHTDGVLVVGMGEIVDEDGERISPAAAAGLRPGDIITNAEGAKLESAEHLADICNDSDGDVDIIYLRNDERVSTQIHAVKDARDSYIRLGIWVRDSTMGVGTLSFIVENIGWYGALGHAIIDADTGVVLDVGRGTVVESKIIEVVKGVRGIPGELKGAFGAGSLRYGEIRKNTSFGLFGELENEVKNPLYPDGIELGHPEEAHIGKATLLCTTDNSGIREFDCEIVKVNAQSSPAVKGLIIQVTDPELLEKTGGIVQGMSGSPLIQDGKLIGVITHVFVNDSTKGYCIYALWMMNEMNLA